MKRRILITLSLSLALMVPIIAAAQNSFQSIANYQNSKFASFYSSGDLPGFLNEAFKIVLSIGGMAAVLRLVYAGYIYMVSDLWTSKKTATTIIGNCVFGLVLLLGIYLILYQINPTILNLCILRDVGSGQGCN